MRDWGKWGQRGCGWNRKLITREAWLDICATWWTSTSHTEDVCAYMVTAEWKSHDSRFWLFSFFHRFLKGFMLSWVENIVQPWGLCILYKTLDKLKNAWVFLASQGCYSCFFISSLFRNSWRFGGFHFTTAVYKTNDMTVVRISHYIFYNASFHSSNI